MQIIRFIDTPFTWAVVGFIVGAGLGVTDISVWLLTAGLVLYLVYLRLHGPARPATEGWLFASGPLLILGSMLGFIVHGLVF